MNLVLLSSTCLNMSNSNCTKNSKQSISVCTVRGRGGEGGRGSWGGGGGATAAPSADQLFFRHKCMK